MKNFLNPTFEETACEDQWVNTFEKFYVKRKLRAIIAEAEYEAAKKEAAEKAAAEKAAAEKAAAEMTEAEKQEAFERKLPY